METSAQEIVLKIGNVINERYLAGKALIPQSWKFNFMVMISASPVSPFLETLYAWHSVQNKDLQVRFKLSYAYEPKQ